MANSERVTGPSNGLLALTLVLLLCVATIGFIWTMHKRHWQDPLDPISRSEAPASVQAH